MVPTAEGMQQAWCREFWKGGRRLGKVGQEVGDPLRACRGQRVTMPIHNGALLREGTVQVAALVLPYHELFQLPLADAELPIWDLG